MMRCHECGRERTRHCCQYRGECSYRCESEVQCKELSRTIYASQKFVLLDDGKIFHQMCYADFLAYRQHFAAAQITVAELARSLRSWHRYSCAVKQLRHNDTAHCVWRLLEGRREALLVQNLAAFRDRVAVNTQQKLFDRWASPWFWEVRVVPPETDDMPALVASSSEGTPPVRWPERSSSEGTPPTPRWLRLVHVGLNIYVNESTADDAADVAAYAARYGW